VCSVPVLSWGAIDHLAAPAVHPRSLLARRRDVPRGVCAFRLSGIHPSVLVTAMSRTAILRGQMKSRNRKNQSPRPSSLPIYGSDLSTDATTATPARAPNKDCGNLFLGQRRRISMHRRSQSLPRGIDKYCGSNLKLVPTSGSEDPPPLTMEDVRNAKIKFPRVTLHSKPLAAGAHIQGDFQACISAPLGRLFGVAIYQPFAGGNLGGATEMPRTVGARLPDAL